MTVCKRVYYSGRVQGVGFRYTAHGLAAGYKVAGWVRNLNNGDVELVAEGQADEVERFLAAIRQRMAGYIESVEVEDESPGGMTGFQIRMVS
jgi:acylphosphatase